MLKNALSYSHVLLKQTIIPGDIVVDATVGNGNDTAFLAALVTKRGKVYGFDIQEEAIKKTTEKLLLTGLLEQVKLFQKGHEEAAKLLNNNEQIAAAIFNLGYLPNSDKKIITKKETTLKAITGLLPRLRKGGLILIVIYYGHPSGKEEKEAVLKFVEQLPQEHYAVLNYQFINQKNQPPFLIVIEKR